MRHKIVYRALAELRDFRGEVVNSPAIAKQAAGLACHDDTTLNYVDLPFAEACDLRGGYPRIVADDRGRLWMSVEIDADRKLKRAEMQALKDDLAGQLTDGIGAGGFDELSRQSGISIAIRFPFQATCTQEEGRAWKPTATTASGNARRIAAIAKLVERASGASAGSKAVPKKKSASRKSAAKASADDAQATLSSQPTATVQPNYDALFRLLAKPERDRLYDKIAAALAAIGGDLSGVPDGVYPNGNFQDPKLLRLLLKAGLRPETLDVKGHPLIYQAAGWAPCIEVLVKAGADVNRASENFAKDTPLMRAAFLGKRKPVETLLAARADRSAKDARGRIAADQVDRYSRERAAIEALLRDGK